MSRRAHGQLRQSQVITTYGPGALVDLPRHSAIVGGLDTWPKRLNEVVEPRLAHKLRNLTACRCPGSTRLLPPRANRGLPAAASALGGFRNGSSFRRKTAGSRAAGSATARRIWCTVKALDERGLFERVQVVPTRFVRACPGGHVDNLDWRAPLAGPQHERRLQPAQPSADPHCVERLLSPSRQRVTAGARHGGRRRRGCTAPPATVARSSPRHRARCATTTSIGRWWCRCSGWRRRRSFRA